MTTMLGQSTGDLLNIAGPLVCAVIWFTALADRRAWLRALLIFGVFVAIMLRRGSQAMLNTGESHTILSDLSGHDALAIIDLIWIAVGLMMLKPLPTEARRPDAGVGFSLGSLVALRPHWTRRGHRAACAREGAEVLGERPADAQPGAAIAGCDRGAADQEHPGLVRGTDQVEGRGDRRTSRQVAAAGIAAVGVMLAASIGYNIHLTVQRDAARDRVQRLDDAARRANLVAMKSLGNLLEQSP